MRIADMNWMQVEDYLRNDDRTVLPLGSTEQHSYLSLSVDSILAERLSIEAEPRSDRYLDPEAAAEAAAAVAKQAG